MSQLSQRQHASGPAALRPAQVLVIVCAGVVMASLDLFIVNVALPQIAVDLHEPSLGTLSWVLNGYAIIYAALLVLAGRLADQHNRKTGFLLGVAVFTVGSAACGAAASVPMLIAFRLVQAAGAALLTPTSLGLVMASYPAERRGGAVRAWTAAGGMAAALGPVIGGLLVAASWRWVFFVNVPIGLAALIIGWLRLPDVAGHPGPRPDALSALLVTAGVGGLTLGLVRGGAWGWGSARTAGVLAGAVVVLGLFALHCVRHHNPLVDPGLFRVRTFSGASLATLLFSVSFGAMLLSIVLWMQDVWGWSALATGLGVAPGPVMVPLFSFLVTGRLLARRGPAVVIGAGAAVFAAGVLWWALAVQLTPNYLEILPGMLVTGIGVGLTLPSLMSTAASSLPPPSFASGSGVVNMLRQVGFAVGVAMLVAVLGSPHGGAAELAAFRHGWYAIVAAGLAAALAAITLRRGTRAPAVATVPAAAAAAGSAPASSAPASSAPASSGSPSSAPASSAAAD
ncbi:MAG TPA: DHA2 family efflux MFS transporter permease subunit [Streptosporangiaceae bacterium]|nr:DHA2 family efflux MFS transporter permease subunit [Streptosporangiaceae bacterium]